MIESLYRSTLAVPTIVMASQRQNRNRFTGWFAAWLNLLGLITVLLSTTMRLPAVAASPSFAPMAASASVLAYSIVAVPELASHIVPAPPATVP